MSEWFNQFSNMQRFVLEFTQNNVHHDSPLEHRMIGHEDRMSMPKGIHLEFSHFYGYNLAGLVFKATQFFNFHQTPASQKLVMASFHIEREALVWYQDTLDLGQSSGWESFVKALQVRFGPSVYDDPMETLTRLK